MPSNLLQANNSYNESRNTFLAPTNYLHVGSFGYVTNNAPEVNMRRTPGYLNKSQNDIIIRVPSGSVVEIIGESEQSDNLIWWYVLWEGHKGWMAEYSSSDRLLIIPAE